MYSPYLNFSIRLAAHDREDSFIYYCRSPAKRFTRQYAL